MGRAAGKVAGGSARRKRAARARARAHGRRRLTSCGPGARDGGARQLGRRHRSPERLDLGLALAGLDRRGERGLGLVDARVAALGARDGITRALSRRDGSLKPQNLVGVVARRARRVESCLGLAHNVIVPAAALAAALACKNTQRYERGGAQAQEERGEGVGPAGARRRAWRAPPAKRSSRLAHRQAPHRAQCQGSGRSAGESRWPSWPQ
jgi:hypothetical protein